MLIITVSVVHSTYAANSAKDLHSGVQIQPPKPIAAGQSKSPFVPLSLLVHIVALRIILCKSTFYTVLCVLSSYYLMGNQRASCYVEWLSKLARVVGGGGDLPLNKTDDVEDGEVDEVRVFLSFLVCPSVPPSPSTSPSGFRRSGSGDASGWGVSALTVDGVDGVDGVQNKII